MHAPSGFHELYQAHANGLYRMALRRVGHAADAEDIVAETFARAWAGADDLALSSASAFLYTIAENLCVDRLRRRRAGVALDSALTDTGTTPLASATQAQLDAHVRAALPRLPLAEREAFALRAEQELSYEDIARTLGISLAAAKVRVHRARLRLAEVLEDHR